MALLPCTRLSLPTKLPLTDSSVITMSLNWSAFLTDAGLNLPNDRWADTPQTTAGRSTDLLSSTTPQRQSLSLALDSSDTNPQQPFRQSSQDSYLSDAYYGPGDYFLSDLEILQPFGDTIGGASHSTSESSPEPSTGIALTGSTLFQDRISSRSQTSSTTSGQSPATTSAQKPTVQRPQTFPAAQYESTLPNIPESAFVENLTFPNGPLGLPNTKTSVMENTSQSTSGNTTSKRTKGQQDSLSACWTSPLCPNHSDDDPPPNPSNCGGACAPFLFAPENNLPTLMPDSQLPNENINAQEITEGIVEIRPRLKRSESESSGRQFSKSTSIDILPKSESCEDLPDQVQSQLADEAKGKTRRRLPHNQIERKYRESLNTQLESLRRVVPALQQKQRACNAADIEDLPAPSKPSKAVVLASATAYIKQMEKDKMSLQDENQLLRSRVKALQALVKCDDCSLMQYVRDLRIHNVT